MDGSQTQGSVSPSHSHQNGFAQPVSNNANPNSPGSHHSPNSQQGNASSQSNWTTTSTLIYTRSMQPTQQNYCTFF